MNGPKTSLPRLCLTLALLAGSAGAALRSEPAAGLLWEEDFCNLEVSTDGTGRDGWLLAGISADLTGLRAVAGEALAGRMTRYLPYDLDRQGEPPSWPYLVLDLPAGEAATWRGLTVADGTAGSEHALVELARGPAVWVVDLRRALPRLEGRAGLLPLTLTAYGAAAELPGPANPVRALRCVAAAPERIDIETDATDGVVRRGHRVTFTVHLAEPATGVSLAITAAGPPPRPLSLDGRPAPAPVRVDEDGRVWRAELTVNAAATPGRFNGAQIHVAALPEGRSVPLMTAAWFDLATGEDAAPRRTLTVARAGPAPRIDGRLDDELWRRTSPSGGFGADGAWPQGIATRLYAAADSETLYLAVAADEPSGEWHTTETARDGAVDDDDAVTVLLSPLDDPARVLRFAVNTAGVVADSRDDLTSGGRDPSWDAPWRAAVSRAADGWSAELALPFAALGLGHGAGAVWGFNVCRTRRAGGALERCAWAGGDVALGRLEVGADLTPYRLAVGAPQQTVRPHASGLAVEMVLPVTNGTGQTRRLTAEFALTDATKTYLAPTWEGVLADGATTPIRTLVELPAGGEYTLRWRLVSGEPPHERAVGRQQVTVRYDLLSAKWVTPPDGMAAADTEEAVVEVKIATEVSDGLRLVAELRSGDEVMLAHALTPTESTLRLTFGLADLPAGEYRLVLTLRRAETVLGTAELSLRRDR